MDHNREITCIDEQLALVRGPTSLDSMVSGNSLPLSSASAPVIDGTELDDWYAMGAIEVRTQPPVISLAEMGSSLLHAADYGRWHDRCRLALVFTRPACSRLASCRLEKESCPVSCSNPEGMAPCQPRHLSCLVTGWLWWSVATPQLTFHSIQPARRWGFAALNPSHPMSQPWAVIGPPRWGWRIVVARRSRGCALALGCRELRLDMAERAYFPIQVLCRKLRATIREYKEPADNLAESKSPTRSHSQLTRPALPEA